MILKRQIWEKNMAHISSNCCCIGLIGCTNLEKNFYLLSQFAQNFAYSSPTLDPMAYHRSIYTLDYFGNSQKCFISWQDFCGINHQKYLFWYQIKSVLVSFQVIVFVNRSPIVKLLKTNRVSTCFFLGDRLCGNDHKKYLF